MQNDDRLFDDINIFGKKRHSVDIDRTVMERDFHKGDPVNDGEAPSSSVYDKFSNKSNFGEITGEMIDADDLEQGMPFRQVAGKSKKTDDHNKFKASYNPHLDFDLYDKN